MVDDVLFARPEPIDHHETDEAHPDREPPGEEERAGETDGRRDREEERCERMPRQLLAVRRLRVEDLRDEDLAFVGEIGSAHARTPATFLYLLCRLPLGK